MDIDYIKAVANVGLLGVYEGGAYRVFETNEYHIREYG